VLEGYIAAVGSLPYGAIIDVIDAAKGPASIERHHHRGEAEDPRGQKTAGSE
jgi:hypothetical protein